jgi:CheY-like chemotaxis protein
MLTSRAARATRTDAVPTLTDPDAAIVLVAHDVEETRDGIERLLESRYRIMSARTEEEAISKAIRRRPDLILVSFDGAAVDVILTAARIRQRARLGNAVPVVIFCVPIIDEGAEIALGNNVYITRPDNFDQIRALLGRLLPSWEPPQNSSRARTLRAVRD